MDKKAEVKRKIKNLLEEAAFSWGNALKGSVYRAPKYTENVIEGQTPKIVGGKKLYRPIDRETGEYAVDRGLLDIPASMFRSKDSFSDILKRNLREIRRSDSEASAIKMARIGLPVGAAAYEATYRDNLPGDRASAALGAATGIGTALATWKHSLPAYLAAQYGAHAASRLAAKSMLKKQDDEEKARRARKIVKENPLYKRMVTRARNLQDELEEGAVK